MCLGLISCATSHSKDPDNNGVVEPQPQLGEDITAPLPSPLYPFLTRPPNMPMPQPPAPEFPPNLGAFKPVILPDEIVRQRNSGEKSNIEVPMEPIFMRKLR